MALSLFNTKGPASDQTKGRHKRKANGHDKPWRTTGSWLNMLVNTIRNHL